MSVETRGHGLGACSGGCARICPACAGASTRAGQSAVVRRWVMNVVPGLEPVLADLSARFPKVVLGLRPARADEVYVLVESDGIAALCATVHRKWQGRIVGLFA